MRVLLTTEEAETMACLIYGPPERNPMAQMPDEAKTEQIGDRHFLMLHPSEYFIAVGPDGHLLRVIDYRVPDGYEFIKRGSGAGWKFYNQDKQDMPLREKFWAIERWRSTPMTAKRSELPPLGTQILAAGKHLNFLGHAFSTDLIDCGKTLIHHGVNTVGELKAILEAVPDNVLRGTSDA